MTVATVTTSVQNPMNSYPLTNEMAFMVHNYDLSDSVKTLSCGGLILYPTDTIWSLGCDATNPEAVEHINTLTQRDASKSLVLLVDSIEMLKQYVQSVHPRIETLLTYHRRPLTVLYSQAKNLPSNVTATDGSIAIRIPQESICKQLIRDFGRPLVAASANISSQKYPSHFGEISSEIICGVDYVVKYQQHYKESEQPAVMVKLADPIKGDLIFLRE